MAIIDKIQLSGTVYTIGNETTTAVTSASTDNEIPTAKAVYDAIPTGGTSITVDPSLDTSSTNPVANSAITTSVNEKQFKRRYVGCDVGDNVFTSTDSVVIGGKRVEIMKPMFRGYANNSTNTGLEMQNVNLGLYFTTINGKNIFGTSKDSNWITEVIETSAITTSVTSSSTDAQVPSAKAVYDALQEGGGSSYSAGTGIDITNNVISVSGVSHNSLADGTKMLLKGDVTSVGQNYSSIGFDYYYGTSSNKNSITIKPLTINGNSALRTQALSISVVETSAITTAITSSSTDAQVPSAKAVNDKLGGLSLVKLTQAEYDALATKDSNVLYVIVG